MIASPPFQVQSPTEYLVLPNDITQWTKPQYDILQTISTRVRLISAQQASRIWSKAFPTEDDLRRCFDQLVDARMLLRYVINAHPLLQPEKPLARWTPGSPESDWTSISSRARRRWTQPATSCEVFAASKQTANLFGSNAHGLPPLEHRDHDLLLSDVYVAYRCRRPSDAARWIGEDFLPKAGFQIKDPDAFLIDDEGYPNCVVESAGRYSSKQVASFHDHCDGLELPYELW